MSRRTPPSEMQFGSDSFLDVLANMVGILIVLLVIAGARAGKQAVQTAVPAPAPAKQLESTPAIVSAVPVESEVIPTDAAPPLLTDPSDALSLRGLGAVGMSVDQAGTVDAVVEPDQAESLREQLAAQTAELDAETRRLAAAAGKFAERETAVRDKIAGLQRVISAEDAQLQANRQELARLQDLLNRDWSQYSALLADFEKVQSQTQPAKEVRHRITPVGQVIGGAELHFRVEQGSVAYVPLEELVARVKTQLEKQKEWIVKFRSHQGTVGPVEGFRLEYLVQRQSLSVVDELRHNPGMVRIGVSGWQIVPEEEVPAESVAMALRPGSKFARRLQSSAPDTALTFWVYPDSFAEFRKLQAAAHAAGFIVSGRPLPRGMPIAGSPQGARSVGQ